MRIVPANVGMCTLHREARRALTQDWVTFDLEAAQLDIAAKEWDISSLQAFLQTRESIWMHLMSDLRITDKQALKHAAMYPLLFGAREGGIRYGINKEPGLDARCGRGTTDRFLRHPLIADTLDARDAKLSEIEEAGGAFDCYDRWISPPVDRDGKPNYRSVLAQLMQAAEFKLSYPVYLMATLTDEFQILLSQYDGFSVKFKRPTTQAAWTRRIMNAVEDQATEMGVHTRLKIEEKYERKD